MPLATLWSDTPRFIKFVLTGVLNTLFGSGCYFAFLWIGLHYVWAAIFGYILGILFNFFSTGLLVFSSNRIHHLPRFVGVYCVTCAVNIIALWILDNLGLSPYLSGLILILPLMVLSFTMMKGFVFRDRGTAH